MFGPGGLRARPPGDGRARLFERARKAGLSPSPKPALSLLRSPRRATALPRIVPYAAVKHVSPDSVVALHVDKPPENVEAPFDLGSVLSDSVLFLTGLAPATFILCVLTGVHPTVTILRKFSRALDLGEGAIDVEARRVDGVGGAQY